jgi:hypothetical protein
MYDFQAKAAAIRADGLQEIELPFGTLPIAGRVPGIRLTYAIDCQLLTLATTIHYILARLGSDKILLGIFNFSNLDFISDSCLEIPRDLDLSVSLAEDIWVVLRKIYEDYAFQNPNFHRLWTEQMRRLVTQEMNESQIGHC